MPPLYLLAALSYGLILVGLGSMDKGYMALVLPLLVYLAYGLIYAPAKPDLEVKRQLTPERASANSPINVTLSVTNIGAHLEQVALKDLVPDDLELIDGQTSLLMELATGQQAEISYTVVGGRGIYQFSGLSVTASDRLGLIHKQWVIPAPAQVFVLPEVPRLKNLTLQPRGTRVYSGLIPARRGGVGVEFFGVREYQPGDSLRYINWRASARHPRVLYSNQFQLERVADIWLVLDARTRSDVSTPSGNLYDHAVMAVSGLAQVLVKEGNRVGLLVYGGYLDWTYPGYGKVQLERILRALARSRTGESLVFEGLDNLPTRLFPIDSQLILVSPLQPEDVPVLTRLRARGYQVVLVSPDPVAYEAAFFPSNHSAEMGLRVALLERRLLISQLRQAGVQVLDWNVSQPFGGSMQAQMRRMQPYGHLMGVRI